METEGKVIVLTDKWTPGACDVPEARSLEMVEVADAQYVENPFTLSLGAQKRLLELIYSRKSGIITRQELIDVLFNPENIPAGTIIRCRL